MVETNCYLLHNEESGEAVLIDPGDQGRELLSLLEREKMTLKAILLTHGHFDHMLAVPVLREATKAAVYAAAAETKLLNDTTMNLTAAWIGKPMTLEADRWLQDGEIFTEAGCQMQMILTPGHTAGSRIGSFPETPYSGKVMVGWIYLGQYRKRSTPPSVTSCWCSLQRPRYIPVTERPQQSNMREHGIRRPDSRRFSLPGQGEPTVEL
jgi:hypothetical protein